MTALPSLRWLGLRWRAGRAVYRGTALLAANTAFAAVGGAAFWVVAARTHVPDEVGRAVGVVNLATLVAAVSSLGLGPGMIRFFPELGARRAPVAFAAMSAAVACALCISVTAGFLLASGWTSFGIAADGAPAIAGLVLLGPALALFAVQDGVLQATRSLGWLSARSAFVYLARLVALAALPRSLGSFGIVAAATLPVGLVGAASAVILHRALTDHGPFSVPRVAALRPILSYALASHVYNVLWGLPAQLMPVAVLGVAGPEAAAYFAIAWMVSGVLAIVSTSAAVSVFIEGSSRPDDVTRQIAVGLVSSLAVLIPAVVGVYVLAPWILGIFGSRYAAEGATLLRTLSLAALPITVILFYCTLCRLRKRVATMIAVAGALATLGLGSAVVGTFVWGFEAAGWAWLLVTTTVAFATSALWYAEAGRHDRPLEGPGDAATAGRLRPV